MVICVPSVWLRWFDIPSATNFSSYSSSSIVLNLSDLSFLISLHLTVPFTGISTVFKYAFCLFTVTYLIVLHILITCSFFLIFIIVYAEIGLFLILKRMFFLLDVGFVSMPLIYLFVLDFSLHFLFDS